MRVRRGAAAQALPTRLVSASVGGGPCSMIALGTTIVQAPAGNAPCNVNLRTYGGGWSGGEARSSFPDGGRGWFAEVPVALEGETARSYAICGS